MSVRGKTVADAIELFEDLAKALRDHKDEFKIHVKEQRGFNEAITARVVEGEKADITINGKLDTIMTMLINRRGAWQVWAPASIASVLSLIAIIIQIWPKGGTS